MPDFPPIPTNGDFPPLPPDDARTPPAAKLPTEGLPPVPEWPRPPQPLNAGTGKTSLQPALLVLMIIGALIYGGITLYESVAAKTSLTYDFSVDGNELSALQRPEVKVDGR